MLMLEVNDEGVHLTAKGNTIEIISDLGHGVSVLFNDLCANFDAESTKAKTKKLFLLMFGADSPVWDLDAGEVVPPVQKGALYVGKQS